MHSLLMLVEHKRLMCACFQYVKSRASKIAFQHRHSNQYVIERMELKKNSSKSRETVK